MGYCTNGFILIGPTEIPEDRQQVAIDHMRDIEEDFLRLHRDVKVVAGTGDDDEMLAELKRRTPSKRYGIILSTLEGVMGSIGPPNYAEAFEAVNYTLASTPPKQLMEEFMGVWNGHYRDTMSRPFPVTGVDKQILVTSERTWGDPFDESGSGYIVDRLYWFGVPQILGIE